MRTTYSIFGIIAILGGAGCAGTQSERVSTAQMEQADERAAVREESVDAQERGRESAIEQRHETAQENIAAADKPAQGASETVVNVMEERATYQSQAKARLDKLGIRIDAAQQKLKVLGSRAPTVLRENLGTATNVHRSLERDVTGLSQTPAANWEATTEKIDQRMEGLDQRLNELTNEIEAV